MLLLLLEVLEKLLRVRPLVVIVVLLLVRMISTTIAPSLVAISFVSQYVIGVWPSPYA